MFTNSLRRICANNANTIVSAGLCYKEAGHGKRALAIIVHPAPLQALCSTILSLRNREISRAHIPHVEETAVRGVQSTWSAGGADASAIAEPA